jgi:hypothetical protein
MRVDKPVLTQPGFSGLNELRLLFRVCDIWVLTLNHHPLCT